MRLQTRLILLFLAATVTPLAATAWLAVTLIERSLSYATVRELDEISRSLEATGKDLYQRGRAELKETARQGRVRPEPFPLTERERWPAEVSTFWNGGGAELFQVSANGGEELLYYVRDKAGVRRYRQALSRVGMSRLSTQYAQAREVVDRFTHHDVRRGLTFTLLSVGTAFWLCALAGFLYAAKRITQPIRELTDALGAVASGELTHRIPTVHQDEVGAAIYAFNDMADRLQQSQERLVFLTRLSSWQALGRKMAHEVKNSLTPIRLTVEEMVARHAESDPEFLEQAAQIVTEEIATLERRVRAFSELAAEPPVRLETCDLKPMIEERVAFLQPAYPDVEFSQELPADPVLAVVDSDLIRGVLTNLLSNAAEAAGPGGKVVTTAASDGRMARIEVQDSGPGLSALARQTLFEPTISFKKTGMGLGLSIARKSALLCGGDLTLCQGALRGAAFRLTVPLEAQPAASFESHGTFSHA